jgi:hypothetical protein
MTIIELGSVLSVDDGTTNNAENVTATAVSSTTFTATCANSHTLINGPIGITRVSDTSIAAAVGFGQQTVQPGSMANISVGLNLIIDNGTPQETVTVTAATTTSFTTVFAKSHNPGAAVTIPLQGLARIDQSGNASIISQNFSTNQVNFVAVSPANADISLHRHVRLTLLHIQQRHGGHPDLDRDHLFRACISVYGFHYNQPSQQYLCTADTTRLSTVI